MDKQEVIHMIQHANKMKSPIRRYPNQIVVQYGDTTSTSLIGFKAASMKLGCQTLSVDIKSDALEDGVLMLQNYGDVMVLRNPNEDAISRAIAVSRIPIIQGGIHSNLSQALTDIYTLYKELVFRGIELDSDERKPLHITFLGYSRTIQPFVKLLELFPNIQYHYTQTQKDIPLDTDVLYVSRIQEGESYHIDRAFLQTTKPTLILMHPFPRSEELSRDSDRNPRSVYLNQLENGLYMKMAMLDKVLAPTCHPTAGEYIRMAWNSFTHWISHFQFSR
jgi:aspartate carbamoyltransferase catalytic subunit